MPKIKLAGSSLYYIDRGRGATVVLLHSYLANAFMWTPQVRALETRYRVIVPDLWGHGSSGALPKGTGGLTALTHQLRSLLDALQIETCVVIGQSVGGMLAAELALMLPECVNGLGLIGTYLGPEPVEPQTYFMRLLDEIEAMGTFTSSLLDEVTSMFFQSGTSDTVSSLKASFERQLSLLSSAALLESIVPIGRMIFQRRDLLDHLHELQATRTLIMCGEHDRVRPPRESMEMAQRIGCRYVTVPEAGHTPNLEQPAFVTDALCVFLDEIEGHPLSLATCRDTSS